MKKTFVILLLGISFIVIGAKFINQIPKVLGIKESAGLRVLSTPDGVDVNINNQPVGKTPYQNDSLEASEISIKLQSDVGSWEGKVSLSGHTITFVNRSLAQNGAGVAGEILTLEQGSGVNIVSSPSGAKVEADGGKLGQTPGAFNIPAGEHTFVISHDGFLNRSIKATVPAGYKLIISADLASSGGITSSGVTSSPIPSPTSTPVSTVKVLETPTGFLRVRDQASIAGKELAQVKPGADLELIEEVGSWDKVKLPDGTVGYVSSQYVIKK